MRILSAFSLSLLLLVGCQSPAPSNSPAEPAADSSDLTRAEALARAARLSSVEYTVSVDLTSPGETFSGKATIHFSLSDKTQPLRLDFFQGKVSRLSINGATAPLTLKNTYWIEFPAALLKQGANEVQVDYEQNYSREGRGLHRFVDQKTKDIYIHSQFETNDASRFMPCFDQPEPRSTLKLDVDAPAKWSVISTTREISIKDNGKSKHWTFPVSPKLSTYLFSLHAGPYKSWTDSYAGRTLRIFAPQELAPFVPAKELFTITKQGIKFYDSYFGYPYPFGKLDQVFVPEFNHGGMENVAAIVYSDGLIPHSKMSRLERQNVSYIILHEIAHMWFGDLVTLKWWDDIWLNESFATIMAFTAEHEATEFKEAWLQFYQTAKNDAYFVDGLNVTHPIEANVASVKAAFANFDGITYGKGASVIKQLINYMSPEKFKAGLQSYIATYAFKNAELDQFIASLQTKSEKDLKGWADRWLLQSGSDELHVNWTCDGAHLKTFEVTSDPDSPARFRPQTIKVALFNYVGGKLKSPTVVPVEMNQAHKGFSGEWDCPNFVYPNYDDLAYSRVGLDPESLNFAQAHMSAFTDPLLRLMIWGDLWRMAQSGQLPLTKYAQILKSGIATEQNQTVLSVIASTLSGARDWRLDILSLWPQTAASARDRYVDDVSAVMLQRLRASKSLDDRKFWFDHYVRFANTPTSLKIISQWYQNRDLPKGFKVDLDRKWDLVRSMNRFSLPGAEHALSEMKKLDASESGIRNAMVCEAIRPNLATKREWLDRLMVFPPKMGLSQTKSVVGALFPLEQSELATHFASDYYAYFKAHGQSEEAEYLDNLSWGALPLNCSSKESEEFRRFLQDHPEITPAAMKSMRISLQQDQRCQKLKVPGT